MKMTLVCFFRSLEVVALRSVILLFILSRRSRKLHHDTLWFTANIMGNAAPQDREIGIKINKERTTAVEGLNFKFESKIIPANAFSVRIPIVIYKTGLKDKSVRLEIEVAENQNFKVGFERYKKAVFIWGDKFLKPDIWDKSNYLSAFGTFTETRYAFILKACKLTELPPNEFGFTF